MSDPKFRAWDGKKMFYYPKWTTLHQKTVLCFSEDNDIYVDAFDNDTSLILMQYTGLKDKHGKEIYEGDIVKTGWKTVNAKVFWHNEGAIGWAVKDIEGDWSWTQGFLISTDVYEVIGNIYENPELLQGAGNEKAE